MSKRKQAEEFQALSERIGHPLKPGPLQVGISHGSWPGSQAKENTEAFRKHWNHDLDSWMGLDDEALGAVQREIKRRVVPSVLPRDPEERELFYAGLIPLINDAWNRSWRNMRHEINRKKQGKIQKSKETNPSEAGPSRTLDESDREAIPSDKVLDKGPGEVTSPDEVASSGEVASPGGTALTKAPGKVASNRVISENAESDQASKAGTQRGSFRPW